MGETGASIGMRLASQANRGSGENAPESAQTWWHSSGAMQPILQNSSLGYPQEGECQLRRKLTYMAIAGSL